MVGLAGVVKRKKGIVKVVDKKQYNAYYRAYRLKHLKKLRLINKLSSRRYRAKLKRLHKRTV